MRSRGLLIFCLALVTSLSSLQAAKSKIKVKAVTFEGNAHIAGAVLNDVMLTRPSRIFNPTYYQEVFLEDDLETLKSYYDGQGYQDMRVVDHRVEVDSLKMIARVWITLVEGDRTYIESIGFIGNNIHSDSLLLKVAKLKVGDPLVGENIEKATLRLLRFFADKGYLEADVDPVWKVNRDSDQAILDFTIKTGIRSSIGEIRLPKGGKTRSTVILRELEFSPGEPANYSHIIMSQRKLYLTGLFESVHIQPVASATGDSTLRDIQIDLKEKQAGELNFSIGYGSLERARIRSEFLQGNLKGKGNKLGVKLHWSSLLRGVETSFSNPMIWNTQWRGDFVLRAEQQFQPGYDLSRIATQPALMHKIEKRLTTVIALRNEIIELNNIKVLDSADVNAADVHSIRFRLTWDSRNNLFNPTEGLLVDWGNEIAGGPATSTNAFLKTTLKLASHHQILNNVVVASSIELGSLSSYGGNQRISLQERFYAGGPNSLRGYPYRLVGPVDASGLPQGGLIQFIWNVFEVRVPVYRSFNVATFGDMGNLWANRDLVDFKDLEKDVGFGLHYISPLGVIRLETAVPVGEESSKVQVYFSMGYAF
ncbi:MAG: outer membrane protein assembly factor BamA [Candidatus Marinimicrobia bacterium]|nr:outer membrane protein assembly factor BamA [Candidatus Neomarinimicrobiota bacterium]MCF7850629.1 outer membrane protein assembly factor BamA [Candidatus Neomarinimicrobiota bacterium]MCF7903637.1 outer membrane protein assembly factor BamA [Candidatus Neomarinimicrobiota bacterium]